MFVNLNFTWHSYKDLKKPQGVAATVAEYHWATLLDKTENSKPKLKMVKKEVLVNSSSFQTVGMQVSIVT